MKRLNCFLLGIVLCVSLGNSRAGVLFDNPPGGWDYLFQGDQREPGAGTAEFDALDGTWNHTNGSDEYDGSEIGGDFQAGNSPGGISTFTEGELNYLRIQDTGDPRDFGFADPGSNRKIYLGHNMSDNGASPSQLDDGVTLTFRARIPTSGVIDPLHRDGQGAGGPLPYPAAGDGYVTSDGGKGNFVIKQSAGGAIAFSLTTAADTPGGDPNAGVANFSGLTMNEFAGNAISGNVNFGQGSATNLVALDPTQWHEFWVVMRKDAANIGTHEAFVYVDGSLTPTIFKMTAGTGSDYSDITYLAIGSTATPQNSALDIDFVGYKLGTAFPPGYAEPVGGWDYSYNGSSAEPGAGGAEFDALDGTWNHANGSDEWDGSGIGGEFGAGNNPGGISVLSDSGRDFIRIQDTGDPRDYGYPDPGSNRKIYLGHNVSDNGGTPTQLDDGFTMSFRARIPTDQPIDPLHRDGLGAGGPLPYPEAGDGYVTSDGGKGNFVIKQAAGGAIAFSLTTSADTPGGNPSTGVANFTGLTMNEFAGNAISGNVNFGQGSATNLVTLDPTDWHTFWIVLRKDQAGVGTHQAFVYLDGSLEPTIFKMTAGTGSDYSDITYDAMGMTATPQNSALDVDFFSYKLGAHFPGGALDNLPPDILTQNPPRGALLADAADGLNFTVETTSNNTLPEAGFKLTLNGDDVSDQLQVTGEPNNRTVSLPGIQPNRIYVGEFIASDQAGRSSTNQIAFDTFDLEESVIIEAEDFNYGGGQFYPDFGVNQYFNDSSDFGVDYQDSLASVVDFNRHLYRPADSAATVIASEVPRQYIVELNGEDFALADVSAGDWSNYTRNFSNDRYVAYLRYSASSGSTVRLDRVTGATGSNQSTTLLGYFNAATVSNNLSNYAYAPMTDVDGNLVVFSLSGATTLRMTSVDGNNNIQLNYLVLAPAGDLAGDQAAVVASPGRNAQGVSPVLNLQARIVNGSTAIAAGTVKVILDGDDVTSAASISGDASGVSIQYRPAGFITPGTSHTISIEYVENGATVTRQWSFDAAAVPVIPGWMGTDPGSGSNRGLQVQVHKAPNDSDASLFPTSSARADAQLAGTLINPATGQPFPNEAAGDNNGIYELDVVNFSQGLTEEGRFFNETFFPGVEDPIEDPNFIAVGANGYLEVGVGLYKMAVHSDDGFRVTVGPQFNDQRLLLGSFEGGRGSATTEFSFIIEKAGVYAFRMVYFEGSGGADVEWFATSSDGTVALVNDPDNNGSIKSYLSRTGTPVEPVQPTDVSIENVLIAAGIFSFTIQTQSGDNYVVQYKNAFSDADWTAAETISGDGTVKTYSTSTATPDARFFRVLVQ